MREQLSTDTWLVLGRLDAVLGELAGTTPESTDLSGALSRVLEGLLALAGLSAESLVRDSGWCLLDAGRRIERAQHVTVLIAGTLCDRARPGAEGLVTESVLITAESVITYRRRRRPGPDAVLELLLTDRTNPRALAYQVERLRTDVAGIPGAGPPDQVEPALAAVERRLADVRPVALARRDATGTRPGLRALVEGLSDELTALRRRAGAEPVRAGRPAAPARADGDGGRSMSRRYRVSHDTSYRYDGDVSSSFGRAHLLPRDGHRQRCRQATVTVTPTPAELREHTDWFGNRSTLLRGHHPAPLAHRAGRERRDHHRPGPGTGHHRLGGGARAGDRRPRVRASCWRRAGTRCPHRGCPRWPRSPTTPRASFPAGRPLAAAAIDLTRRIHRDFRYVSGSTTVGSSVAELLDRREGVCQDFAHLAVAALRSMGLPARYVSGYLETTPPPGRERLVGADASHAWASVFTGTGWLDVDPTNDRVVDASYVEVAHGRDYADVPPLKGVIFSDSGESVMHVAVDVMRLADG